MIWYIKWSSTDRTTLQIVLQNLEEFTECFHAGLQTLKKHDFIAKEQSKFCWGGGSLKDGEMINIIVDFAENYSCTRFPLK